MSAPTTRQPAAKSGGVMLILLTLAGWTSIPLFLKHFSHSIDGWTANGWRYGFSALLWLPVLLVGMKRRSLPPGLWRAALVPSLFNTAAQMCFGLAPYYIDPGLMTFSMRLQIIFLAAGAAFLFAAERKVIKTPGFIAGMLLVLGGTCLTLLLKPGGLGGGTGKGVALSIACGLLYASYGLAVRRNMQGLNPFVAFAAVSQYTAFGMVGLMLVFAEKLGTGARDLGASAMDLPRDQFFWLLVSAVVGIGLGHTMYFASIARLGLAVSAGVVQLQPITVSFFSCFVLHQEKLTPAQWASGGVAIIGAALVLYTQHRVKRAEASAAIDEFDDLPVDPEVALVAQANEPSARPASSSPHE